MTTEYIQDKSQGGGYHSDMAPTPMSEMPHAQSYSPSMTSQPAYGQVSPPQSYSHTTPTPGYTPPMQHMQQGSHSSQYNPHLSQQYHGGGMPPQPHAGYALAQPGYGPQAGFGGPPPGQAPYGGPQPDFASGAPPPPQAMAGPPPMAGPPVKSNGARICGIARAIFWVVVVVVIILILGGIGAGLGVGLSQSGKRGRDPDLDPNLSDLQGNNPTTSTSSDSSPTPTSPDSDLPSPSSSRPSSGTPSTVSTTSGSGLSCPDADNTTWDTGDGSVFRILCNTRVPAASFLGSDSYPTLDECIRSCDDGSTCVGVMYNFDPSASLNCDSYIGIMEQDASAVSENVAFAAYDWVWDT